MFPRISVIISHADHVGRAATVRPALGVAFVTHIDAGVSLGTDRCIFLHNNSLQLDSMRFQLYVVSYRSLLPIDAQFPFHADRILLSSRRIGFLFLSKIVFSR